MSTYENLNRRRIPKPVFCPLYHNDPKSDDHLLRFCSVIRQKWDLLHLTMPLVEKFSDYKAWLVEAFRIIDDRDRKLLSLVLWSI